MLSPRLDERPIEVVSIEGRENGWFGLSNVLEELLQQMEFIGLVEYSERTHVVVLTRRVFEVRHILTNNLSVGN